MKVFALSKAGLGSRAKIGIRKTLDCLALARDEKRGSIFDWGTERGTSRKG